jgi:hypothetical protein
MTFRRATIISLAATTTMASALLLSAPVSAFAADEAVLAAEVTPSTGLSDGQEVTATATGAVPGELISVGQCAKLGEQLACDPTHFLARNADENGAVAGSIVVSVRYEGVDPTTGTPVGTVDCATVGCFIGVASEDFSRRTTVPISFG